jgi:EmrB/QacA subfamily drug resistance transporter
MSSEALARPPREARSSVVLLIASAATFLAFLDVTVVNVAFPDLRRDFADVSLSSLSWVVTAYGVVFAALLTPAGRVADLIGRRRVFLAGVAAFTISSALTAAAPTASMVIAARTLQGAAAAAMIPAALGMVLAATSAERRAEAVGLWAAAASIAAAAGPTLGGVLIDVFDWRAVFIINVPIGIAALAAGVRVLPDIRPTERELPDIAGTVILATALALVVVGLTKAGDWGWGSTATLTFIGGGAALLAAALVRASGHSSPALEIGLWRNRVFASANLTSLLLGTSIYAWLLLCVLFVVAVWDYSILQAGLAVSPGAFTSAAAAVVAGRIADRGGARGVVVFGALLLAAVGIWLNQALTTTPDFVGLWLPAGLIGGVGMGAALTGATASAAASLPPAMFAAGTGLNMTARQLGGALGVAVLASILEGQGAGLGAFRDVFLFCTGAAVLASIAGLRLQPASDVGLAAVPAKQRVT